jgi:four helix bundle protein
MGERIERFEDLIAWQKARLLTSQIYKVTMTGDFGKDFGLKNQIQRAAVSVMSNIAEGFERARPAEFHQYLSMAKASCAEIRSQLYVAFDVGYLDEHQFNELMTLAQEVARIIGGLRTAVGRNRDAQKKHSALSTQSSALS